MKRPLVKTVLSMAIVSVLAIGCSAEKEDTAVATPAQEAAPVEAASETATSEKQPSVLNVDTQMAVQVVDGVPGRVEQHVVHLKATVKKVNVEKRVVKLEDAEGNIKALRVGPEAVNFDQLKPGDKVEVVYAEELVIALKEQGAASSDGVASMVERAPEGEKPNALAVETQEVTAVVQAVDLVNHTATLKFPDGKSHVMPVRPDVELREDQVGREVLFKHTMAMAISVKPAE